MPLITKDFDTMVNDTIDRIKSTTPITNDNANSVIMNIIESILGEFDVFNYKLNNVYNAISPDDATGTDLDRAYTQFGITRNAATKATAVVKFYVSTANDLDVTIPSGTLISTPIDPLGNNIEFVTTEEVVLSQGSLNVNANVKAVDSGVVNLTVGSITVINDSVPNIEGVTNESIISSGTDEETDDEFRDRAADALYQYGTATDVAIRSALLDLDEVTGITILDLNRGNGTSDVVISTSTIPPSQDTQDAIDIVIADNKASGIDVQAQYPSVVTVDVDITLSGMLNESQEILDAKQSITDYTNNLTVAQSFIINQMEAKIINDSDNPALDMTTTAPATNQTPGALEVYRVGTITINGQVR